MIKEYVNMETALRGAGSWCRTTWNLQQCHSSGNLWSQCLNATPFFKAWLVFECCIMLSRLDLVWKAHASVISHSPYPLPLIFLKGKGASFLCRAGSEQDRAAQPGLAAEQCPLGLGNGGGCEPTLSTLGRVLWVLDQTFVCLVLHIGMDLSNRRSPRAFSALDAIWGLLSQHRLWYLTQVHCVPSPFRNIHSRTRPAPCSDLRAGCQAGGLSMFSQCHQCFTSRKQNQPDSNDNAEWHRTLWMAAGFA